MKLVVFSHKEVWPMESSPSGFGTVGGFPLQIREISELFDATRVVVARRSARPDGALTALSGHRLEVVAPPEPAGRGVARKLSLLPWLLRHGPRLWREVSAADAVHALVPGDIGTLGLLLALARGRPLLVRHCGTWNDRSTLANRFLAWLLPRVAAPERPVLATGAGTDPPSSNPSISWIFATALSEADLRGLHPAPPWDGRGPLELVSLGRLTAGKNTGAAIEALPALLADLDVRLTVVGDGPERGRLERLAVEHRLGDRVTFTGNLTHAAVLALLPRFHLLVFPSRVAEGFPKAVLDAMACGVPVVATDVSALPHLLRAGTDEACGRLLSSPDAAAIVDAIAELAARPEELAEMGRRAAEQARHFSLERWAEAIRDRILPAWPRYEPPSASTVRG